MGGRYEGELRMTRRALRWTTGCTYRCTPAGIEEEVCSVSGCGWLVGDGPVAQSHAHNGRHVSLSAKDMDGDPSGLPCEGKKRIHHSSLQVTTQVYMTLQRPLPGIQCFFLHKTNDPGQTNYPIFTTKQLFAKTTG